MQKSLNYWIVIPLMVLLSNLSHSQSAIELAKSQMDDGNFNDAIVTINQHISTHPTDTKAFLILAQLQIKLGKIDLACATYGVVESLKLTNDEFYIEYGKALKMAGKYDDAITKFNMVKGDSKPVAEKQIKSCQQAKDLIKSSEGKRVMNLDINSEESDFGAFMYNNLVFFASKKAPFMSKESMLELVDYSNPYLCKSLLNGSASALMIEFPAYIKNTEAISITDNNKIAFCVVGNTERNIFDRMRHSKISFGEYNGQAITHVEDFSFNSDNYSCYSPCLADNGTTLYFASDMPGGMGGFDIYVSTKTDNQWSPPVNLGSSINTDGDEITPFYANGLLWFSSNGLKGEGGFDIFNANLTSKGFVNIKNAEQGINTDANEIFPMVKNLVVYFTSDKAGGKGNEDLYRCPLTSRNYIYDIEETTPASVQVKDKETPPAAYNLYAESYKKSINSIDDDFYSGAKRVSLSEFVKKTKAPVYFIQLAAMVGNKFDSNKYKSLLKYGNVYKMIINGVSKVRLGYFLDRSSTESILAKVKNSGFKDAFIVAEDLNSANLELLLSNTTDNSKTTTSDYSIPSVENTKTSTSNFEYSKPLPKHGDIEYKVRLGSYEDPIWFDIKKVRDLGRVEQWTKGNWTIFILGGYSDMAAAEQARIQAVNRGYVDAEVVIDNGGIIERIKQN